MSEVVTIPVSLPKRPACTSCGQRIEFTDSIRKASGDPYHERCWLRVFDPTRTAQ